MISARGSLPDLELSSGPATLGVRPDDGGRWTSLRVGGLELLASADDRSTAPTVRDGCFPMAPYAGRIRDGRFSWRGRTTQLPLNAPPHALHGTVRDRRWELVELSSEAATLRVDLGPSWPYRGSVLQHLRLSGSGLTARLELHADEDMPAWLGFHPWFRRRLSRGGDARLLFSGGQQYELDLDGLPTGRLHDACPGPYDDCLTGLATGPAVHWPGAVHLTMTSSHAHWVLFDQHPSRVCVEPQTAPPDAVNLGRAQTVPASTALILEVQLHWQTESSDGSAGVTGRS